MFKKILGFLSFIVGLFLVLMAYVFYDSLNAKFECFFAALIALVFFVLSWRLFTDSKRKIKKLNQNNFYVPSVNKSNLDEGPTQSPLFEVSFSHSQSSNKPPSDPEERALLEELIPGY